MAPFPAPTKTYRSTAYPTISPSRPELSQKGKTVVITGGGTGIGAETAKRFAEAGAARIVLLGRREKPLLDTKASIESRYPGVEVLTASADITKKDQIDSAFASFVGNGKIDVMVSNAAMTGPLDPVETVDTKEFLHAVNFNVEGSLYVAQAFLRHAAKDAVAIDVNSSAAHLNFGPGFSSYSVGKLAVYRLWDSLGFANPNMSVFHIQPGVVPTDMNSAAGGVEAVGEGDHVSLPGCFNVWLASSEAQFLKGKFLWTNWDVDELKTRAKEIEESRQLNVDLVGWPFGQPGWKFQAAASSGDAWSA